MVLPTGQISMDQVNTELGSLSGPTATISLNDTFVRYLAADASPTSPFLSGTISKNDLRGKRAKINATGGNYVATSGGYKIHVFTAPGTFTINWSFNSACTFEYLIVAGGGGGTGTDTPGGGGGAGGFRNGTVNLSSPFVGLTGVPFQVSVGSGGAGSPSTNGGISFINAVTIYATVFIQASGGGRGIGDGAGGSGGSGGGAGGAAGSGGVGNIGGYSPPEGNPGGLAVSGFCGGGGGASQSGRPGSPGAFSSGVSNISCGGNGSLVPWLNGFPVPTAINPNGFLGFPSGTFAGGGGGAVQSSGGGLDTLTPTYANGGSGGGGNGSGLIYPGTPRPATAGRLNTGGGGGGGGRPNGGAGQAGGSGIVVVRYLFA